MKFEDIELGLNRWLAERLYDFGFCVAKDKPTAVFRDLAYTSSLVTMRWYISNNTLRFQFCGDILRPMEPVFTFDYFVKGGEFSDHEKVENHVRELLPHIKVARCYHCGNRFGAKMMGGAMTCDGCSAVVLSDKAGYIYLYGNSKYHWYKIGRSSKPDARVAALDAIQLPFKCHVLHTFLADDAVRAENDIHSMYQDKRQGGEWFELSEKEVDEISSIKQYRVGEFLT